jgi:endonuclease/exonuclease/phosphatase family metal-dependent hydrolase
MAELRVASYNIHRCIGTDGQYQPDRIRQVLRSLDAQVVALQEVESGAHHGELLEYLVEGSDWQVIEGATLHRHSGRYGNAVLTSLAVLNERLLDVSFKQREPRGAIDLELALPGHQGDLRVIATHLGLRPGERRAQTRQLLDWMGPPQAGQTTLLMGDMNEWFLWGRPLHWLRAYFGATPAPPSFPSRWPWFALDRIWAYPRRQLIELEVMRTPLTRLASDHLPIIASLRLDRQAIQDHLF